MPNPPTLLKIVTDALKVMGDLEKQAEPLIAATYAFSQVLGKWMAAQTDAGPPATYYIADPDPGSPHPTGTKAPSPEGYTHVAGLGFDQAAGFPLAGSDFGVYMGPGMSSVAVAVGSTANGVPIMAGNPTLLVGPGALPLAGVGTSTATGAPVVDGYPENVQMAMPRSWSPLGKHRVYTAAGTGAQPTEGLAWDTGSDGRLAPYYDCKGVEYPAIMFPMGPGIKEGITNLVSQISSMPGGFALVGYSQGAVVTSRLWRDEILNPNGQLHDRLGDIFVHITYGNPLRCPGISRGNALVGIDGPVPLDGYVTGGIAGPDDLTPWQTPPWMMDFAHDGDMYAACPVGADPWSNEAPPGKAETSIYNIFMEKFVGQSTIVPEIGELLTVPIPTTIAIIEGLINTLGFFAANQEPHTIYGQDGCMEAAVQYLLDRGKATPT
jgi:hypothetical protein